MFYCFCNIYSSHSPRLESLSFKVTVLAVCLSFRCAPLFHTALLLLHGAILDQLLIFRQRLGRHAHRWVLLLRLGVPWWWYRGQAILQASLS